MIKPVDRAWKFKNAELKQEILDNLRWLCSEANDYKKFELPSATELCNSDFLAIVYNLVSALRLYKDCKSLLETTKQISEMVLENKDEC